MIIPLVVFVNDLVAKSFNQHLKSSSGSRPRYKRQVKSGDYQDGIR